MAAAIAENATAHPTPTGREESFLLAQLLARAVRGRPQILDVTRAGWSEQLPADVGAAFDEDLRHLGKRESAARALLTALAWANGPGLPWETIWIPVARALAVLTQTACSSMTQCPVAPGQCRPYIVEELGDGSGQFSGRSMICSLPTCGTSRSREVLSQVRQPVHGWSAAFRSSGSITRALLDTVPTADRHDELVIRPSLPADVPGTARQGRRGPGNSGSRARRRLPGGG